MKKIINGFLVWRLWLFIPLFLGIAFIPFRKNSLFTTLWQYTQPYPIVESEFVYPWANFDGVHYIAIASRGYVDEARFMPLFPFLIKTISIPIEAIFESKPYGSVTFFVAFFTSTIFSLLGFIYLFKLLLLDYKREQVSQSILLFLLFPTAFFFAMIYTEGLFLLLSVLSLYAARKQKWLLASMFTMFLSVTRLSGILIIIPLLYEYYLLEINPEKKFEIKKHLSVLWFLISPSLIILYSYYNFINWGDALYFVHAHGQLENSREVSSIVLPFITVYRYFKIFLTVSPKLYEFWIAILEFISLIYVFFSLFLLWKKKIRVTYILYVLSLLVLPLLSGTLSGFPRYILPMFPLFLANSLWLSEHKKTKKAVIVIFVLLQSLLLMLFARGYYIS